MEDAYIPSGAEAVGQPPVNQAREFLQETGLGIFVGISPKTREKTRQPPSLRAMLGDQHCDTTVIALRRMALECQIRYDPGGREYYHNVAKLFQ